MKRIDFKWALDVSKGFDEAIDTLWCEEGYSFEDYLSDHEVSFDKVSENEYVVLDGFGDKTNEVFMVISEYEED